MNIHIDAKDVTRKLEKLSTELARGLPEALELAGEIVRKDAVMNCPKKTGTLARSIVSNVDGNSVTIGPTANYGIFVEYGTGAKGDPKVPHTTREQWVYNSGGQFYTTSGQKPQPFLVPALKNNKSRIKKVIGQAVNFSD